MYSETQHQENRVNVTLLTPIVLHSKVHFGVEVLDYKGFTVSE